MRTSSLRGFDSGFKPQVGEQKGSFCNPDEELFHRSYREESEEELGDSPGDDL